jgi:hypothetical protein
MSISTTCPSCGQRGKVPDQARGRRVRCPSCKQTYIQSDDESEDVEAVDWSETAPPPRVLTPAHVQAPEPSPFTPPVEQRVIVMPAKSGFSFFSFFLGGCVTLVLVIPVLVIIGLVAITALGTSANATFGTVGNKIGAAGS